jgi:two-component system sensor histidine kinase/response regulator
LDVIERIRELASSPSSDFIMISARDLVDAERRITDARLAGLIAKPATPSSLLEALLTGIGKPGLTPVAASLPAAPNACRASSGQQVLLIEDNEVNLLIASEFLKSAGLLVTTASSAQEAIDLVSSGARFDLLFMDVQMAHMDGLEATRVLRTMPCGADLVIVALTAHALQGDRARCLAAGMDDYLSKPLSPEALNKCLRRWLNLGLGT